MRIMLEKNGYTRLLDSERDQSEIYRLKAEGWVEQTTAEPGVTKSQ